MRELLTRYRQVVSPIVAATTLLLAPGCMQQAEDVGAKAAGEDFAEDAGVSALDDKAALGSFQLRNEGTGECVRRSTSLKVGNGYEVYQASCSNSPPAEQLWRQDCSADGCRYVSGSEPVYCLKASSSLKASGGSFSVYAATCSSDRDQRWDGFRNRETGRCMYASESELTSDGDGQLVQRACATSAKFNFTQVPAGGPGTTPPPPPPTTSNPFCKGGTNGEQANQRESGTLSYNSRSVAYEMRGGVIKLSHSPNACVATNVSQGQTQLVALGTSDGGCSTCKVGEPVDKALMVNQGFSLVEAIGDQDARSEVWARVFDSAKSNHRGTIAISGNSKAVAWVIATVGTSLSTGALANNAVSTGSGKSIKDSKVSMSGYQSSQFQFKFLAAFLDDTCSVDEEDEEDHMLSFWSQGDGDTFFVGMWGAGESAKSGVRVRPLEDSSFDVAIIATGANP